MQKSRFSLILRSLVLAAIAAAVLGGCITLPSQMPAEYFSPRRDMNVSIINKCGKPEFSSSSSGLLAGSMYLVRESLMKKCLANIDPKQIEPLLRARLPQSLAEGFTVTDADTPLLLEITLDKWGWSVEAGKYGIRTDSYKLYISGTARIIDRGKNGKQVYSGYIWPDIDIGMQPTEEICLQAFPQAVNQFADDLARYIMKGKPK